ncbi:MAG TPA: DUF1015 domain-containing protein [Thermomicrobiales bacterium]
MAEVRAFRGVRYGERVAAALGQLLAPPYDVSSPHLIADLRDRHPYNMVHLEHVAPDPGEDPHAIAAAQYRAWRAAGILARDYRPALYGYEHEFTADGRRITRRGLFAAVRLAPWRERIVLPHEATFPGPVRERHRRLRSVRANISPVYLLYEDPAGEIAAALDAGNAATLVAEGSDPEGETHRLTAIADAEVIGRVGEAFRSRRLYVADGHHRYEAAVAYRDEYRAVSRDESPPDPDGPGASDYLLALLVEASDPGVRVLPTHRLVRGLPAFDPPAIRERLASWLSLEPAERTSLPGKNDLAVLLFAGEAGAWRVRRRRDERHLALLPPERSEAWRRLAVAVIERVVLEEALGIGAAVLPEHVTYAHEADVAREAVTSGDAQIAILLDATPVSDIIAVAEAGETMPAKSTYFWPKVPAGLVLRDLG